MAYMTLQSGYCTGSNPGSVQANNGGLRMYWELRLYTSAESPTIMNKSYSCPAGSYRLYYRLQAWYGITVGSRIRIGNRIGTTNAAFVRFRSGTEDLWSMGTTGYDYASRNPSFGDNNPPNTWYDVADATYSDSWRVYPEGLIAVSQGTTLSLNLTYNVGIWYRSDNDRHTNANATSGSTSVKVEGGKFELSISAGTGSTIVVNRGGTNLGNGAVIYVNDVLTISFAPNVGYELTSKTVNGTAVSGSSTSVVVTGGVIVASAATRLSYTLTINADENCLVTVTRGGTPMQSGDTIYYGDALTVLALPQPGYEIASATINGAAFTGQTSVNVTGNVTVSVTVSALGFAWLHHSGAFVPYLIYLWHLSAWARYRAYLWKSGAWAAY